MNVLVTGAAGYVGSIVTEELVKRGHVVVAFDNLQRGHRTAIHPKVAFIEGELADLGLLQNVFQQHGIDSVMHMAAETLVADSVTDIAEQVYFLVNGKVLSDVRPKADETSTRIPD